MASSPTDFKALSLVVPGGTYPRAQHMVLQTVVGGCIIVPPREIPGPLPGFVAAHHFCPGSKGPKDPIIVEIGVSSPIETDLRRRAGVISILEELHISSVACTLTDVRCNVPRLRLLFEEAGCSGRLIAIQLDSQAVAGFAELTRHRNHRVGGRGTVDRSGLRGLSGQCPSGSLRVRLQFLVDATPAIVLYSCISSRFPFWASRLRPMHIYSSAVRALACTTSVGRKVLGVKPPVATLPRTTCWQQGSNDTPLYPHDKPGE